MLETISMPDVNSIQETVKNFDWSLGTNDLILLAIFVVSILFHFFFLKKDKIFAALFSIYTSYLLVLFFPYHKWLTSQSLDSITWIKVYGFIGLIIILTFIFSHSRIFGKTSKGFIGRIIKSIIYGILNIGLIISLLTNLLPLDVLNKFSGFSLNIFMGDIAKFVWLGLPIILMLFFFKLKRRGPGRPPS